MGTNKIKGIILMRKILNLLFPILLIFTLFILQRVNTENKALHAQTVNMNDVIKTLFVDYCNNKGGNPQLNPKTEVYLAFDKTGKYITGECAFYKKSGLLVVDRDTLMVRYYIKEVE